MTTSSYSTARLAAVYDALNPLAPDDRFYIQLAGERPRRILDVGAGTGRLACELATRGHRVTAADPALAMLRFAAERPGGEAVRWIESDAASLALNDRFDLIVMTGHAFQTLLDDQDIHAGLQTLAAHLAPDAQVAFETRNPTVGEWEQWTPDLTREQVEIPSVGTVEVCNELASVGDGRVSFYTHFTFPDGAMETTQDTIRFTTARELEQFLASAGLGAVACYGDWNRTPSGPTQPEIITIAVTAGHATQAELAV